MFNHFHYALKDLKNFLEKEMNRCCHLLDKYPDDERFEETMSQLNIYQSLFNYISGSTDVALEPTIYDYMVESYNHSCKIGQFKQVEEPTIESVTEEVTLPFEAHVPEVAEQVHYEEMVALETETKKKKTKVKK